MQAMAKLKYARISAQKARLVADQIRGLHVEKALNTLAFSTKKGAPLIKKVLESAIANAEHNEGADIDALKVATVMVDEFLRHDLSASWSFFTPVKDLLEMLKQGDILMPIIGSWNPPIAHVMTLIAWDEEDGFGFANTQYQHHNTHWVAAQKFSQQWNAWGRLLVEVMLD